jgi:hypothetical protein
LYPPIGSLIPALGIGFILPSPPASPLLLLSILPVLSSIVLLSISSLSSVVLEGSPGSSLLIAGTSIFNPLLLDSTLLLAAAAAALVLGLLLGGPSFASIEFALFLCLELVVREGDCDSAASSADASREDGCRRSAVEDFNRSEGIWVVVRLRFAEELFEEGEDMSGVDTLYTEYLMRRMGARSNRAFHSEGHNDIEYHLKSLGLWWRLDAEVGMTPSSISAAKNGRHFSPHPIGNIYPIHPGWVILWLFLLVLPQI